MFLIKSLQKSCILKIKHLLFFFQVDIACNSRCHQSIQLEHTWRVRYVKKGVGEI